MIPLSHRSTSFLHQTKFLLKAEGVDGQRSNLAIELPCRIMKLLEIIVVTTTAILASGFQTPPSLDHQHRNRHSITRQSSSSSSLYATKYDLCVVGGGVVGVQAALAAASFKKKVCLIDAPREGSTILNEDGEDLSIGAPTGLFGKALRDVSKRIKVSTLRGMGLREDR